MNKITLMIFLLTTPSLFSMQKLVSRQILRNTKPNRSIVSFQKREISTEKAYEILNPVKKMCAENKDTLRAELNHKCSKLRYLAGDKKLWNTQELNKRIRYRSKASNEKEYQLALERNQIHEDLYEQISNEWQKKEQKDNQSSSEEKFKSHLWIALHCFQDTGFELKKMLLEDQKYQRYIQNLYFSCR